MKLTEKKYSGLTEFVEKNVALGDASDPPRFVIISGGVGVGKTTHRKDKYSKGWVLVDAGEVYQAIRPLVDAPEDEETLMYLAGNWLLSKAIADHKNIVIEIIMDKVEPIQSIIGQMKGEGYEVELVGMVNDIKKSWENNLNRDKNNTSAYYTQDETLSWFEEYFRNKGRE
jgi:hypothetical protein